MVDHLADIHLAPVAQGVADAAPVRAFVIAVGLSAGLLFILVGLGYELQIYGDGAIFAYADAAQDAWAFHWHNISSRLTVYVLCHLPAEAMVALTHDAWIGVIAYGFLFFAAPLCGLMATFALDRSKGRAFFTYACLSTACLCPLIFGFPTEMWVAHSLFWPALAICHSARSGARAVALMFVMLLALVFTHESAVILAGAILATLALRVTPGPALRRTGCVLGIVAVIWIAVRITLRPDPYIGAVLDRAALNFFDIDIFTGELMLLLLAVFLGYGVALAVLRRIYPANAHICAMALVMVALGAYWLRFDQALHAENRYYLRTVVFLMTLAFGVLASVSALEAHGELNPRFPVVSRVMAGLRRGVSAKTVAGALCLVMLVHAVETVKFTTRWTQYTAALRMLAMSGMSDPALGSANFASARRIDAALAPLFWPSTTPFLSVLTAPGFAPARLVVDPVANYFWLPCAIARENEAAERALPVQSRRLVREFSCLHR
jgi:hypothetical protein